MSLRDHAVVHLGDYRILLIGISAGETLEKCDGCKKLFSLIQVEVTSQGIFCEKCKRKVKHEGKKKVAKNKVSKVS